MSKLFVHVFNMENQYFFFFWKYNVYTYTFVMPCQTFVHQLFEISIDMYIYICRNASLQLAHLRDSNVIMFLENVRVYTSVLRMGEHEEFYNILSVKTILN